jgi:hypothetical protein
MVNCSRTGSFVPGLLSGWKSVSSVSLDFSLVIYGSGNTGQKVLSYLEAQGYRIDAFLDAYARTDQNISGVRVMRPAEWVCQGDASRTVLVVAIHNRDVDMFNLLDDLDKYGFARIVTMVEFVNLFPDGQPSRYWLAPSDIYDDHIDKLDRLFELFEDPGSRQCLEEILRLRIGGDYRALSRPTQEDQYCPGDLPKWRNPMRLVDCGAFDGDTLSALSRSGYRFESVVTFEPDLENYVQLAQNWMGG